MNIGKIKERTFINITLVICAVLFMLCLIFVQPFLSRNNLTAYSGVVFAVQFGLCLIMIAVDHKKGVLLASLLLLLSVVALLKQFLDRGAGASMAGVANSIVYIIVIVILNQYFKKRDKEAVTDYLTGLYNIRGLFYKLKTRIEDGKPFDIIYIDLGNFKIINDNFGHNYGDRILKQLSGIVSAMIKDKGYLTRVGGDEFVIVVNSGVDSVALANSVLEKIREKIVINCNGSEFETYLTVFGGIASYPKDATDRETLLKYADIAMFEASKSMKNEVVLFNKDMEATLVRRLEIENLIIDSLKENYFYCVYQPQYELQGKKLRGFETLIRMKTPQGEMISPSEFIPVAEGSNLIFEIDNYVLHRAMVEFRDVIKKNKDLIISVNVSAKNIASFDFPNRIARIIEETDFRPENLEIEITEYCLVQSIDLTIANITKLREMGIHVALDDFGTGYTSLSYLAKMPIDLLKIDKSMIDNIVKDEKARDFANAVISMGHLVNCDVISEGVETEEQLEVLESLNCEYVQGYVWGRPLDLWVALELIK